MSKSWLEKLIESSKDSYDYKLEKLITTVTERLVAIMDEKNISKVQLARMLDVSPSYITKLLRGTNVSIAHLLRITDTLGVELDISMGSLSEEIYTTTYEETSSPDSRGKWTYVPETDNKVIRTDFTIKDIEERPRAIR